MALTQASFFLSWESHKNNICNGMSHLQQNEEFVDMTLAADGHRVKVHQMVMALASPYIKELLSSADCPHPVLLLSNISYATLSAILEYVYTGEVLVSVDNLPALIQAAKDLHIKGLEDMKLQESHVSHNPRQPQLDHDMHQTQDEIYFEVVDNAETDSQSSKNYKIIDDGIPDENESMQTDTKEMYEQADSDDEPVVNKIRAAYLSDLPATIQYTVSNQGSLQMILNRYMYYLKHSKRNNSRQWRCVDYLNARKCPALVVTKKDVVIQRVSAHNHPFHDQRILKKVEAGAVFAAIHDAEKEGNVIKTKSKSIKDDPNDETILS